MDPGVVFGNGLHPTTRHCLKALAFAAKTKPLESVLDMGTGTGILAIASACLGAEAVFALDINPLCVKTALKNVKLNDLQGQIRVVEGSAEEFMDRVADVVIANIHQGVIERLLKNKGFRNKRRVIISGLMRSPYREVKDRLIKNHYSVVREWDHEMTWFTCLAENKKCA